jgi:hypothetical protein
MDLQIPLMIIDLRGVSVMSSLFTNRRVTHLRFIDAFEWIRNAGENAGQRRNYFDKTTGMVSVYQNTAKGIIVNVFIK